MMFLPCNASSNDFELKFGLFVHELMCSCSLVFNFSLLAQRTGQHSDSSVINFIFIVSHTFLVGGSFDFSGEIVKLWRKSAER